jgi:hypothetical protein
LLQPKSEGFALFEAEKWQYPLAKSNPPKQVRQLPVFASQVLQLLLTDRQTPLASKKARSAQAT